MRLPCLLLLLLISARALTRPPILFSQKRVVLYADCKICFLSRLDNATFAAAHQYMQEHKSRCDVRDGDSLMWDSDETILLAQSGANLTVSRVAARFEPDGWKCLSFDSTVNQEKTTIHAGPGKCFWHDTSSRTFACLVNDGGAVKKIYDASTLKEVGSVPLMTLLSYDQSTVGAHSSLEQAFIYTEKAQKHLPRNPLFMIKDNLETPPALGVPHWSRFFTPIGWDCAVFSIGDNATADTYLVQKTRTEGAFIYLHLSSGPSYRWLIPEGSKCGEMAVIPPVVPGPKSSFKSARLPDKSEQLETAAAKRKEESEDADAWWNMVERASAAFMAVNLLLFLIAYLYAVCVWTKKRKMRDADVGVESKVEAVRLPATKSGSAESDSRSKSNKATILPAPRSVHEKPPVGIVASGSSSAEKPRITLVKPPPKSSAENQYEPLHCNPAQIVYIPMEKSDEDEEDEKKEEKMGLRLKEELEQKSAERKIRESLRRKLLRDSQMPRGGVKTEKEKEQALQQPEGYFDPQKNYKAVRK